MRVFWAQILVVVLLAVLSTLTQKETITAAFLGAIICVLTHFWFAWVVFRPKTEAVLQKENSAQKILITFYLGILGKWVLTALLFLLAFKHVAFLASAINAVSMIAAYVFLQILQTVLNMRARLN